METIDSILKTEEGNLEEAKTKLDSLKGKWFKFGKTELINFLEDYIRKKEEFIEELKGTQ